MNCGESFLRLPTFLLLLQCHRWSVVSKRVVKTHYPCLVWSLDLDSCGGRFLGDPCFHCSIKNGRLAVMSAPAIEESVVISYGILFAKIITINIPIAINSEKSYTFAISFGHVWLCQDTIGQKPIKFG